jgi:sec-independent protein translocase protein TatA
VANIEITRMAATIGPLELIIILAIIILIFGAGKIETLGSALGKGIREFRKATNEAEEALDEIEKDVEKGEA